MAAFFLNPNGSIRDFTPAEIAAMRIRTRGIRDGSSPRHTRDPNGSTVQMKFLVDANYLERFAVYMLGASVKYTDGFGQHISRLMPQTFPGKPQMVAVKIDEATGFQFQQDDTTSKTYPVPTFRDADTTITFQHLPFFLATDAQIAAGGNERDRYVQVLPSQHDVSYLNLPGGIMRYIRQSGTAIPHGAPIPFNLGIPIPESTIRRKWFRVPYNLWGENTILFGRVFGNLELGTKPYVGTINTVELFGYPPGYLLYLGIEESLELDPLGDDLAWDLTHKWLVKHLAPHT
jgi:hypothetical protein